LIRVRRVPLDVLKAGRTCVLGCASKLEAVGWARRI
jgi:hypothetical protein